MVTLVVYGVLVPAVLAGLLWLVAAFAAPDRLRGVATNLAAALGLGAGGVIAFRAQFDAAEWPPLDARSWMYWTAILGAALGVLDALLRLLPKPALGALRFVPAVVVAIWLPRTLMAPLVEHTFEGNEAALWLWGGAAGLLLLWVSLDLLASRPPASRGGAGTIPFAFAAAATVLMGGAAAILVLGRTASLAQLLGAGAAALGGIAAASLIARKRPEVSIASAVPVITMSLSAGLLSAHHYAELTLAGLALVVAAPVVAAAVSLLPPLKPRVVVRSVIQVTSLAAVLGVAAALAERPEEQSTSTEDDPYDYGYGYDDAADSPSTPTPDYGGSYDYESMKDWRPPDADTATDPDG